MAVSLGKKSGLSLSMLGTKLLAIFGKEYL